jgi:hypothetical protein
VVKAHSPNYLIQDLGSKLVITVPSKKHWLAIAILLPMFFVWTVIGGAFVLGTLSGIAMGALSSKDSPYLFGLLWSPVWLFGEMLITASLLWELTGTDIIEVTSKSVILRRQLLKFSLPQRYPAEHIKDLRILPANKWLFVVWISLAFLWHIDSVIAFDYRGKTIRTGSGVNETEGAQIISIIQRRFPQCCR